jgi:hypothetical protein
MRSNACPNSHWGDRITSLISTPHVHANISQLAMIKQDPQVKIHLRVLFFYFTSNDHFTRDNVITGMIRVVFSW